MSERVYRVQDAVGRGPFRPGFSHCWVDVDDERPLPPPYMDEFGWDIFERLGREGEFYGSAVRDVLSLSDWFNEKECRRLAELGYAPVALLVDRILAESKHQLVFARRAALYRGAVVVPWPSLRRTA